MALPGAQITLPHLPQSAVLQGPQKALGWVVRKAPSTEEVQDLPTQIKAEMPASWGAFTGGLTGIITRFHVLPCSSSILTH